MNKFSHFVQEKKCFLVVATQHKVRILQKKSLKKSNLRPKSMKIKPN